MVTEYEEYLSKRLSELREYSHQYYLSHRDQYLQRAAQWRKTHTERRRQIKMKSRHKMRRGERHKIMTSLRYYFLRNQLMALLGTKCVRCGYLDMRALCLDHVNGGGSKEFDTYPGAAIYRYYLRDPELAKQNLQILCANCNSIKRYEKREFSWKHKPKTVLYSSPK